MQEKLSVGTKANVTAFILALKLTARSVQPCQLILVSDMWLCPRIDLKSHPKEVRHKQWRPAVSTEPQAVISV